MNIQKWEGVHSIPHIFVKINTFFEIYTNFVNNFTLSPYKNEFF